MFYDLNCSRSAEGALKTFTSEESVSNIYFQTFLFCWLKSWRVTGNMVGTEKGGDIQQRIVMLYSSKKNIISRADVKSQKGFIEINISEFSN